MNKKKMQKASIVVLLLGLSASLFFVGAEKHSEYRDAISDIEKVNADLADGSLDNYTETEARVILYSSEVSMYQGLFAAFWSAFGLAALFTAGITSYEWFYADRKREEEVSSE